MRIAFKSPCLPRGVQLDIVAAAFQSDNRVICPSANTRFVLTQRLNRCRLQSCVLGSQALEPVPNFTWCSRLILHERRALAILFANWPKRRVVARQALDARAQETNRD